MLLTVQGGTEHAPLEDLLLLLSICDKHVAPELFNKLFRQVSGRVRKEWGVILGRRWVIRLPSHEEEVCTRITKLCRQAVTGMSILEGLKAWLKHSLTCIPLAGPKAWMASKNSAPPRATGWTAELLQQLCDPPPSYSAAGYGKGYRLPPDWEVSQAKEVILRRVMGLRCACEGMWKEVDCTVAVKCHRTPRDKAP